MPVSEALKFKERDEKEAKVQNKPILIPQLQEVKVQTTEGIEEPSITTTNVVEQVSYGTPAPAPKPYNEADHKERLRQRLSEVGEKVHWKACLQTLQEMCKKYDLPID